MNETETTILNRCVGYAVHTVSSERSERDGYEGLEVVVHRAGDPADIDFFFPDYAGMNDAEMAEVVANNLKEELWNSVHKS